jgi:2-keto-4-pentenoate hydratase
MDQPAITPRLLKSLWILFSIAAILVAPVLAHAACPDDAAVKTYLDDFTARRPNTAFSDGLSLEDARCARRKLLAAFPASLGPAIGYRASFSNDMTRALLRLDEPVWGAMYGKHLLSSPARVSVKYGAVPYWDADLLVEVKDAGLADAKTPLEALNHISAVVPFIGLKDNMTSDTESIEHFVAINAGFRSGVMGRKIAVKQTRQFLNSLAKMTVVIAQDKQVLVRAKGSVIMDGQPINSILWLVRKLKDNGIVLKQGDLLAVGGFAMTQPPILNTEVNVKYVGLPGNPSLAVRFE